MVDDARIVRLRLGDDRGELVTDIGAKPVLIAVLAASVAREAHHVVDRLHRRSLTEVDASLLRLNHEGASSSYGGECRTRDDRRVGVGRYPPPHGIRDPSHR